MSLRYAEPSIIEMIGGRLHFAWLDMQHGAIDVGQVAHVARAAECAGTSLLVRVPDAQPGLIGRVLDLNVAGVIVPLVETVAEATAAVAAARFPPLGNRSYGGRRIIDRRGARYHLEEPPVVVIQLESPAAAGRALEIARVDGVDVLMPGPDDLGLRLGPGSPPVEHMVQSVLRDARASRIGALALANDASQAPEAVANGATMVSLSSDHVLIRTGVERLMEDARARLFGNESPD